MQAMHRETARQLMEQHFVRGGAQETVAELRARLAREEPPPGDTVFLTDTAGRLTGTAGLVDLLRLDDAAPLAAAAKAAVASVDPDSDQEAVAVLAHLTRHATLPVVDREGTLLGVIPPLKLIDVLHHEHDEDVHRLAGIRHQAGGARTALELPVLTKVRNRLPWLLAGLAGCLASALLVSRFEEAIRSQVAITFFLPAIVYLADAIGTQTEAIVVRGLSRGHLPLAAILPGEAATGIVTGAVLGALTLPVVALLFAGGGLALAVALSILCAGGIAGLVGLLLPWLLSSRGLDPAYGSGPIGTIVQDLLSVAIYFALVTALAR
jgi:magnesium transporter